MIYEKKRRSQTLVAVTDARVLKVTEYGDDLTVPLSEQAVNLCNVDVVAALGAAGFQAVPQESIKFSDLVLEVDALYTLFRHSTAVHTGLVHLQGAGPQLRQMQNILRGRRNG